MTDQESILRGLRPLRPQLEEVAEAAHATASPRRGLRLAQRLIAAAIEADFAAIARAARRARPQAARGGEG